jgi:hypothetical protein
LSGAALHAQRHRYKNLIAAFMLLFAFAYGSGTAAALGGIRGILSSTAVPELRYNAVGMQNLDVLLRDYPDPLYTLDYQLAGWIRYKTGRQALSSWGQYSIWGIPELDSVTILSLGYLPDQCVTQQLHNTFGEVSEMQMLNLGDNESEKHLHIWRVSKPWFSSEEWGQQLDFLTMWKLCQ